MEKPGLEKYGSRKFILSVLHCLGLIILPILYKKLEIADSVLMTVIGATSAVVATYTGFNVLAKKVTSEQDSGAS